ncbi:unknown [Bacteroides thetaiotaomicron CAG:40]|nr:unknown [Bacteroides thetaiotaomicron CAG:40]
MSASTSYPTRVRPEIFTYDKSFAICEASIFISLDICVEETKRSPLCFSNLTFDKYHGSLRKVGSGTFVQSICCIFWFSAISFIYSGYKIDKNTFFFGIARMIHTISTQVLFSRKR